MAMQAPISKNKLQSMIGKEIDVLVDGVSDESELVMEGRYWGQAPEVDGKVFLSEGEAEAGQMRKAIVSAASDYDLVADLIDDGDANPRKRSLPLA